jgi:hypothetical protein
MRVVRLISRDEQDALYSLLDDLDRRSEQWFWTAVIRQEARKAQPVEPTSWMRMTEAEREEIRPRRRLRLVTGAGSIGDERQAAA